MTNKEIEKVEQKLCEIQAMPFDEQPGELLILGNKIGVNLPHTLGNVRQSQTILMTQAMHSFLQSKMMLNACVSANRSCFWAAVAAIAAFISVVLGLFAIFRN
jgi:hypothetical protein